MKLLLVAVLFLAACGADSGTAAPTPTCGAFDAYLTGCEASSTRIASPEVPSPTPNMATSWSSRCHPAPTTTIVTDEGDHAGHGHAGIENLEAVGAVDVRVRGAWLNARASMTGAYVLDLDHGGWAEIHPLMEVHVAP